MWTSFCALRRERRSKGSGLSKYCSHSTAKNCTKTLLGLHLHAGMEHKLQPISYDYIIASFPRDVSLNSYSFWESSPRQKRSWVCGDFSHPLAASRFNTCALYASSRHGYALRMYIYVQGGMCGVDCVEFGVYFEACLSVRGRLLSQILRVAAGRGCFVFCPSCSRKSVRDPVRRAI